MINYLKNIWYALINRPVVQVVIKEEVVQVPFSREQVQKLKQIFPQKRASIDTDHKELLINEGQLHVIDYITSWGKRGEFHAVS